MYTVYEYLGDQFLLWSLIFLKIFSIFCKCCFTCVGYIYFLNLLIFKYLLCYSCSIWLLSAKDHIIHLSKCYFFRPSHCKMREAPNYLNYRLRLPWKTKYINKTGTGRIIAQCNMVQETYENWEREREVLPQYSPLI